MILESSDDSTPYFVHERFMVMLFGVRFHRTLK